MTQPPDAEPGTPSLGGTQGASPEPAIVRDYRALSQRIRREGLGKTNDTWYLGMYVFLGALLLGSWTLAPSYSALAGLLLGLFCQQAAFLGHDLGHNSVMTRDRGWLFNRKYKPWGAWIIGNLCFGVDGLNWSAAHDGHHRLNLRYDEDPQNVHLPWLLYEAGEIPYYERRAGPLSRFHRHWLRYQHLIMIPLLLVYGKFNIMKGEVRLARQGLWIRFAGILLHILLWIVFTLRAVNPLAFFFVALTMAGFTHIQILLSHAYMPRFTAEEQRRIGWIRYQILGTQNVDTHWYDDWFHGGLQFQIEHHLWPWVPRHNLAKIKPFALELCANHDLPYNSDPLSVCLADMLRSFYRETRAISLEPNQDELRSDD